MTSNNMWLVIFTSSNLLIWGSNEGSLPRLCGALLLLLLPGIVAAHWFRLIDSVGWTNLLGLGLSYTIMTVVGLGLHYLPGPISAWMVMLTFNLLTLTIWVSGRKQFSEPITSLQRLLTPSSTLALLILLLLWGAVFRLTRLGYSEFQIDEVKVMTAAAQAIEGQPDAFFLPRKKGPVEIILPMLLWTLTGTIQEAHARLLFALASLAIIITTYFLARDLFHSPTIGLFSAWLMTLNGFMIGFGRVVQYQVIVVWMCLLVLMTAWQWYHTGRFYWLVLSGTFYAIGLLSHYDALLIGPSLAYLILARPNDLKTHFQAALVSGAVFIGLSSLFFLPYLLNPQIARTGNYLAARIGGGEGVLKNRLDSFFDVMITFHSFYYLLIIGLLLLAFIVWSWHNLHNRLRYIGPLGVILSSITLFWQPNLLSFGGFDGAVLVFAIIFLGAIVSPALEVGARAILMGLAVTFLGYNFAVADPRTHIYAILPAWVMLSAVSAAWLWQKAIKRQRYLTVMVMISLTALFSGYLYLAYLRPYPEFTRDWPISRVPFYWSPYNRPGADFGFGFVHRVGWKTIGGLYLTGQLSGDYQTNDKYEIADWYTHYSLRGCYQQAKQFFQLARNPIDPIAFAKYKAIGQIQQSPQVNRLILHQQEPTPLNLGNLTLNELNDLFDQHAYPARFIPPNVAAYKADFNANEAIKLIAYDLTIPQWVTGQPLAVTLHWQSQRHIPFNLESWVELQSETGEVYGHSQNTPDCADSPTSEWTEGEVISDLHIVTPTHLPPGRYRLMAGLYFREQNLRVPFKDSTGTLYQNGLELEEFELK